MGRLRRAPRQARADQTVRTLYEAAAQILQTRGLQGLTTSRVAEQAGYSVGTVYLYFRNKESLLQAMAMHEVDLVEAATKRLLDDAPGRPLDEILRSIVKAWLRAFSGRQQVQRLVMQAMADHHSFPEFQNRVAAMAGRLGDQLTALDHRGLRVLSPAGRFVMTRALVGVIRARLLEIEPLVGPREMEDELVHMLGGMMVWSQDSSGSVLVAPVEGSRSVVKCLDQPSST